MHDSLVNNGDSTKMIYIGEFGYPSSADTWLKAIPDATRVDYLKTAYSMAKKWGWVSGLQWFNFVEIPPWEIVDSNVLSPQNTKYNIL